MNRGAQAPSLPLHVRQHPHGWNRYVKETLRLTPSKTRTQQTLKGAGVFMVQMVVLTARPEQMAFPRRRIAQALISLLRATAQVDQVSCSSLGVMEGIG